MNSVTASLPLNATIGSACARLSLAVFLASSFGAGAQSVPGEPVGALPRRLQAPPPFVTASRLGGPTPEASGARLQNAGPTQYSIGEPTDEEQFLVERINRARANPAAEGERLRALTDPTIVNSYDYFHVDLGLMVSQFAAITNAPPLSINAALTRAARGHSLDMLTNRFQGHMSSDGRDPGQRLDAVGYHWQAYSENVYANAESLEHAHAGFEVDWGGDEPGGMQNPPGHRNSIHNPGRREVGVGVVLGFNDPVGPMLVTQDFGTLFNSKPFITGVAYYDLNTNGFYDAGEGLGGVRVSVAGVNSFAITANSGGYSVPVPGDGAYALTFSIPGLPDLQQAGRVVGLANVKIDFAPAYHAPAISGSDRAYLGLQNAYLLSTVAGAEQYELRRSFLVSTNFYANAEEDLEGLIAHTSPEYSVVVTNVVAEGKKAYHLAHTQLELQSLTLDHLVQVGPESILSFRSRLGLATTKQEGRAEISTDFGTTWRTLWSQRGTGEDGDTNFFHISIPLTNYSGAQAKFRFVYDPGDGSSYYSVAAKGVGLYLDSIAVTLVEELMNTVSTNLGVTSRFIFTPSSLGYYTMAIRPTVSHRLLEWGPTIRVEALQPVAPTAVMRLGRPQLLSGGDTALPFQIAAGAANLLILQAAPAPGGPWETDPGAVIQAQGGGLYRATTRTPGGAQRYYRLQAQ